MKSAGVTTDGLALPLNVTRTLVEPSVQCAPVSTTVGAIRVPEQRNDEPPWSNRATYPPRASAASTIISTHASSGIAVESISRW
jgi:hypothetical protein